MVCTADRHSAVEIAASASVRGRLSWQATMTNPFIHGPFVKVEEVEDRGVYWTSPPVHRVIWCSCHAYFWVGIDVGPVSPPTMWRFP